MGRFARRGMEILNDKGRFKTSALTQTEHDFRGIIL